MRILSKICLYLTLSFLLACQESLQVAASSAELKQRSSPGKGLVYQDGSQRSAEMGMLQSCEPRSKVPCTRLDVLLLEQPDKFETLFKSAVVARAMSQVVAFRLLFLALLEQRAETVSFLLEQGISLSREDLHLLESSQVLYPASTSSSDARLPLDKSRLNALSDGRFKRLSLDDFQKLAQAVSVDARPGFYQAMSYIAAAAGHVRLLEFLESKGVDFALAHAERFTASSQRTPLFYAITFWEPEAARFLINRGLRLDAAIVGKFMTGLPKDASVAGLKSGHVYYALAMHPHQRVKEMMEVLLMPDLFENEDVLIFWKQDLLSLAAGFEGDKPDLEAMAYLLKAGARSYGQDLRRDFYFRIPTAFNAVLTSKATQAEKSQALSLLMKYNPELHLRGASFADKQDSVELIAGLIEVLSARPELQEQLRQIKSGIELSNAASSGSAPACDQAMRTLLEQGATHEEHQKAVETAIARPVCSDELLISLVSAARQSSSDSSVYVDLLKQIAGRRPHLLSRLLEQAGALPASKTSLQDILASMLADAPASQQRQALDKFLKVIPDGLGPLDAKLLTIAVGNVCNRGEADRLLYLTVLQKLLAVPGSAALKGRDRAWPLLTASRSQPGPACKDVVDLLLERGADPNAAGPNGETALMGTQDLGIIKSLVEHGADINVSQQEISLKEEVLARRPAYYHYTHNGLLRALAYGDRASIIYLLEQKPVISLPYQANLLYAAIYGLARDSGFRDANLEDLLQLVLEHVNPNERKILLQDELLLYMFEASPSRVRLSSLTRFLLAQGLNPNVQDREYTTPLMRAAQAGTEDVYQLLLKAGADPTMRNLYGESAAEIRERMLKTPIPTPAPTSMP